MSHAVPQATSLEVAPVAGRRAAGHGRSLHQPAAAAWAGFLFLASGLLVLANLAAPAVPGQSPDRYLVLALLDVTLAALIWLVPWGRLHARASVVVVPLAYLVVGLFEGAGALTPYAYASFFILVAVWLGLFHPPHVSLLLAPLTVLGYSVPLLDESYISLRSVPVVVPITLVVAQVISRVVTDAERARRSFEAQALQDPLTGLPNRRYFEDVLERLLAAHLRLPPATRPPLAAVAFDLDHFREINNRYGHDAGDAVLRAFAEILRRQIRAGDLAARVGGEEFTVVLPGSSVEGAMETADRVRAALDATPVLLPGGDAVPATVSAGCSELPDTEPSKEALLRAAEVGLAMAKRAGRNRVVAA